MTIYSTAASLFTSLAAIAEKGIQPEGRGAATAATLRQEGQIAGDLPLTSGALKGAFERLAVLQANDDGPTKGRRATCAELAALIEGEATEPGSVVTVFNQLVAKFATSDDPRQKSIAKRAHREALELSGAAARFSALFAEDPDTIYMIDQFGEIAATVETCIEEGGLSKADAAEFITLVGLAQRQTIEGGDTEEVFVFIFPDGSAAGYNYDNGSQSGESHSALTLAELLTEFGIDDDGHSDEI